jgi:hypothetical protein
MEVAREFLVREVDKAVAQAFGTDACMEVLLTPSGA